MKKCKAYAAAALQACRDSLAAMGRWNAVLFLILAGFCFLTMYYADVTVTSQFGLTFLDSLLDGKPLSFYQNALDTGIAPEGAVYDIGMYVIFGLWSVPVWIIHHIASITGLTIADMLWYKLLLVVFVMGTVLELKKIAAAIRMKQKTADAAGAYFLLTPLALFPVLVAAQYDIIPLYFMMAGLAGWFEEKDRRFYIGFALSMLMKPMTALIFLLLLLEREKNVFRLILQAVIGFLPFLVIKFLYGTTAGYQNSAGQFMSGKISGLFESGIAGGFGNVSLLILGIGAVYVAAWLSDREDDGSAQRTILHACLIWEFFVFFGKVVPYWSIYLAPFIVLTALMCGKKTERILWVLLAADLSLLVVFIFAYTWVYGGDKTYSYLLLKGFVSEDVPTVAGFLRRFGLEEMTPAFSALFTVCYLAIPVTAALELKKNKDAAMDTRTDSMHVSLRIACLLLWVLLTLAALAAGAIGIGA